MKHLFLCIAVLVSVVSCTKDDTVIENQGIESQEREISFIFKNQAFKTTVDKNGALNRSSLSDEVEGLLEQGNTLELGDPDKIYLFENKEDLEEYIQQYNVEVKNSTPERKLASLDVLSLLYDHPTAQGGALIGRNAFYYPFIKQAPHRFDDRISSAKVENYSNRNYVLKAYEHPNKAGRVHTIIAIRNQITNFANFAPVGLDDRISSVEGYFLD
ncbi:hypothetical protein [Aquimarina sp. RZ0]|uniref:hypothetical protein n=1 Tax=Aquimarina sp. RZ0 TaxID=2607730 RepID=UPI0011F36759|nr:hypothetical protein [Aquimarina sp. RZ0]KAA1244763.1 hypothetical protein F0000_14840 [Aquimarina sp. RZ0]